MRVRLAADSREDTVVLYRGLGYGKRRGRPPIKGDLDLT